MTMRDMEVAEAVVEDGEGMEEVVAMEGEKDIKT